MGNEKFNPRKDAIFSVLNDWLEVSSEQFDRFWLELDAATRIAEVIKPDPLPWVTRAGLRVSTETIGTERFLPRLGYSYNRADYLPD